jgi:oxidase EvaA
MAEQIQIVDSCSGLDALMERTIASSGFALEAVSMDATADWSIRDGAWSHRTGGFFDVVGVEEASGREHLLMYQPQSALTGLAFCEVRGVTHVLLQARIEPGNTGVGQWGPTIQSTPANFLALHGGKQTPTLDLFYAFSRRAKPLGSSMQLDLGERYFHKSKWHNYVLLDGPVAAPAHMAWVSLPVILAVLGRDHCLNADLRSLLAVFNWDRLAKTSAASPGAAQALLDELGCRRRAALVDYRWKSVSDLQAWEVTDRGIEPVDRASERVAARLFHATCGTREVSAWYQPMICAPSRGRVTLAVRESVGAAGLECLLQVRREVGVDGGFVLTATEVRSPGEAARGSAPTARPPGVEELASFVQSDEGGRFYQHETTYQLVMGDWPVGEGMHWLPIEALKASLSMSNVASFQLRCISSLLMTEMCRSLKRRDGAGSRRARLQQEELEAPDDGAA